MIRWSSAAARNQSVRVLLICAGITAVHLAFRLAPDDASAAGVTVSQLPLGASVTLDELPAGDALVTGCRMIVSFSPTCPFCKRAADRERARDEPPPFGTVIWATPEDAPVLSDFVEQLGPASISVVDADLFEELSVRAVPGLFLIDAEDRLRWVGPYRGDEPEGVLRERCSGGLFPESDPG